MTTTTVLSSAKWTLIAAIFQKVLSFVLNNYLISIVGPAILGQSAIQFELILSTLLFLSREGIRVAVVRETIIVDEDRQTLIDLSWIPSFIIFLSIIVIVTVFPYYNSTVILLYCIGAFLESLSEPFYNSFQNALEVTARIRSETIGLLIKSIVTIVAVAYIRLEVEGFGYAQVSYGAVYFLTMLSYTSVSKITTENGSPILITSFRPDFQRLLTCLVQSVKYRISSLISPKPIQEPAYTLSITSQRMCSTAYNAFFSVFLKHWLTEADKVTLSIFTTHHDQGLYAVSNNYGSLVARLLFLPLEDSSRLVFAKTATEFTNSVTSTSKNKHQQALLALTSLKSVLIKLLALLTAIGILFPVFGVAYMDIFVRFVLGMKWQGLETVRTLQTYCFYILFLGINGISEAFVQSVTPHSSFGRLNKGLILSSIAFTAVAIPSMRVFGTRGVILANIASMVTRIGYNMIWIHEIFNNPMHMISSEQLINRHAIEMDTEDNISLFRRLIPPLRSACALLVAAIVCAISHEYYKTSSQDLIAVGVHVGIGGVVGIFVLVTYVCDMAAEDRAVLLEWLVRKNRNDKVE